MREGISRGLGEMFRSLGEAEELEGFWSLISPLVEYDREHNSDLVKTLRVFFEANANASEAAQRLYLHRNSMNYRLDRVQNITGLDIKDPESRLALQLGLLSVAGSTAERERKDEPECS